MIISTAAPTVTPILVGGQIAYGSGEDSGRDVYGYFNNDGGGHAVRNAWTLRSMIST